MSQLENQKTMSPEKNLREPAYSKWDQERLMGLSAIDFSRKLYHRAKNVGDDLYDSNHYEFLEMEPELYRENLINYMRRRAWSEWYFGTVSPARQITLLPDGQMDLKLRIARQIHDEIRHFDVFAAQLRRYGSEPRINEFVLPEILVQMQKVQMEMKTASEIAATNQFAGEVVLSSMTDLKDSIFARLFDEELMSAIRDIETDEPHHIAVGRDLILLYCETFEQRKRLAEAQEKYLQAMMQLHVAEIVKLGCCRVKPLPVFD
jgi:hypothetical protein